MSVSDFASTIDHTLLKPDSTPAQVQQLCREALRYHFASVCVLPSFVPLANTILDDSAVAVCTVVGFPLGATYSAVKAHETREAIARGAREIDMVMNIAGLKNGQYDDVLIDMEEVVEVAYALGCIVKVIVETCLLTHDEKLRACELVTKAQAGFIKTSTGFSTGGATVDDVRLLRSNVGPDVQVKASGGIRTLETAMQMLDAGATRLGASAGVALMEELAKKSS